MKFRGRAFFVAATVLIGFGAAAHAEDKVVNVYNWSDYVDESVLADFTAKTGIKVVYDTYDSMETLEAKLYAGSSGYDVIVPTDRNLQRMIQAGILQKLDKSKLPNEAHQWDAIAKRLAAYDPGNQYAENYMWGTTGIGYNVDKIKKIMPDAPVDSLKMIFDPKILSKFKSCGIDFLDSPDDLIPAALVYLGLPPNSKKPADLQKAGDLLSKVAPYVQKFHSSEYINALANGDICLAVGYVGDVLQARDRAAEAKNGVEIAYSIPKEGALMWLDAMAMPAGAPHRRRASPSSTT
jgi:putrescine transport system substrate-binding protein